MAACENLESRAPTKPPDPYGSRLTVRHLRWPSFENETSPASAAALDQVLFQAMTFMLDCILGCNCQGRPITLHASKCGFRSIHLRPSESFKKNFGHHSVVLMLQEVTVEYRDAADDRIREIHYEIE
jgi:hypothetical protein